MTKAVRALRIAGIALAFVVVFTISQQATLARSGEQNQNRHTKSEQETWAAVLSIWYGLSAGWTVK